MAEFKIINHDNGPPLSNYWTKSITDANNRLAVNAASALGGSPFGMQIAFSPLQGTSEATEGISAPASNEIRLRFRYDPNTPPVPAANQTMAFIEIRENAQTFAALLLRATIIQRTTADQVVFFNWGTDSSTGSTANKDLVDGPNCIELACVRSSSAVANDGTAEFFVNGVSQHSATGIDNFDHFAAIDEIHARFAAMNVDMGGTIQFVDELLADNDASRLLCGSLQMPPMTRPTDVDAAGSNLYIALLDNDNPVLLKMDTGLASDASEVFAPGSGSDIGVQCGRFDSDVVWIAGAFDGTNVVEKSENGGTSFTVKDDGTFGDIEAFVVGPDSDERVLISDVTNDDIQETTNDGSSWTQINSSVGFDINVIARLGINVEEAIFGNDASATDNIDYSINSGDDMEDFTTGDFPTDKDVTSVIVN